MTPEEVAEHFDVSRFGAAPTKLDVADLRPLTARHLQSLPASAVDADLAAAGVPEGDRAAFWDVVRENVATRAEIADWARLAREGAEPLVAEEDRAFVEEAFALLPDPPYGPATWSEWTGAVKDATGRKGKGLFLPLRHAVTGRAKGPDMAALMPLLRTRPG